jgi:hypothetical protein
VATAAAEVTHAHEDIHETEAAPTVFGLTPDEQAMVAGLQYLSAYEIAHLRKTAPDVEDAFDGSTLAAIEANAALGGKARADQIRADVKAHAELTHVASVLAPLVRLVGQNLLTRGASLGLAAGEVMKVATGLSRSQPHLVEQLATLAAWTRTHHGGRGKTATPATPPAATPPPPATPPAQSS